MKFLALSIFYCLIGHSAPVPHTYEFAWVSPKETKTQTYTDKKNAVQLHFVPFSDGHAIFNQMKGESLDLAFLPPFSLAKAEAVAGAKTLVKSIQAGHAQIYGAIVVKKNSAIETEDDLEAKTIAWANQKSAAGHFLPKASLVIGQKIIPQKFFKKEIYLQDAKDVIAAVQSGLVDAGAVPSWDAKGKSALRGAAQNLRVIFVSEASALDGVVMGKSIVKAPALERVELKHTLLGMKESAEGRRILKELFSIDSFVDFDSQDYNLVKLAYGQLSFLETP